MLKIKDDVDLKELEKFGFHYRELDETLPEDTEPFIIKQYTTYGRGKYDIYPLYIDINTRIIDDQYVTPEYAEIVPADLIYDLIKANLVQKVGGEDE